MIRSSALDPHFSHEVMAEPGGEHLIDCWSCGTCASTCLVRRYDPEFNPRRILRQAGMGMREAVLSSAEIWLCSACDACFPRCPKQIHISEVMRAIRAIAIREGYQRPGVTAVVDAETCIACGLCVAACPYEAISLQPVEVQGRTKQAAQVDRDRCMACGICNAVCLSSVISVEGHADRDLSARFALQPALPQALNPTLVITCNWCLHAETDVAYAAHPPEGVTLVNVPCSGRVTPVFLTTALQRGASKVLVVGCKEDECHYKHGNKLERSRAAQLQGLLDLLGIEPERVQFAWLGAQDRGVFPALVEQSIRDARALEAVRWQS